MNSYQYEFKCFEDGDDDWTEFTSYVHPNMPSERIAEAAADYYFWNCDGQESEWPRNFWIRHKGEDLGTFDVLREDVPEFTATRGEP